MHPDYFEYIFSFDAAVQEILLAFLPELGFEGLDYSETDKLKGYIPASLVVEGFDNNLKNSIPVAFNFDKHLLENKNWNATWEASFDPVVIGEFCALRASFHDPILSVKHEIVIDPKMAFGTGHHETTSMMIEFMSEIDFLGKSVFDYGCGTGVLAILANQMGATNIMAIDYDINSVENTNENIVINKAEKIQVDHGELDIMLDETYDVILANINKNVLKLSVSKLHDILNDEGFLLLSGILNVDKNEIIKIYEDHAFSFQKIKEKGEWISLQFSKA